MADRRPPPPRRFAGDINIGGRGDIVDPSSAAFMGFFRRNDRETIQIMAKAAKIVPKACDILGISLSDSESEAEEENDDTAVRRGERSPSPSHHREDNEPESDDSLDQMEGEAAAEDSSANVDSQQVQQVKPMPAQDLRAPTPTMEEALGSHVRKSRKRCASTPSTLSLGQSTSSTAEGLRSINPPTHKKRRFPSISISSGPRPDSNSNTNGSGAATGDFSGLGLGGDANNLSWGNLTPEEYAIRKKMMQDMELLQEQLNQLADLEKKQYALMQRFFKISRQQQQEPIGEQDEEEIQNSDSTTTNSDGTNDSDTATTTTTTTEGEDVVGASNDEHVDEEQTINQSEQVMDINIDDAEIFTDADLNIGAEEVVVDDDEVEMDDQEVGSLM